MKSYKARGVVLHSIKYGDSGAVVSMLTDTLGRQSYMVQGIRSARSKSNKQALYQPMFLLEYEGGEPKYGELHRMRDVRNAHPLMSTPFDPRKNTISLFMAEAVYRLIKEVEVNLPLFDFIYNSVVSLDELNQGVANFHLWFLVGLSRYLGFFPGNEWFEGAVFDIEEGLFMATSQEHKLMMSQQNSELLWMIMRCESGQLGDINLSRVQRSEFLRSILIYFGYHLDGVDQIRSLQILKEVF